MGVGWSVGGLSVVLLSTNGREEGEKEKGKELENNLLLSCILG